MLVDYRDSSLDKRPFHTERDRARSQVLLDFFEGRWRVFWNLLWHRSWFDSPESRPDDITKAFSDPEWMTVQLYDGTDEQEARRIHEKVTGMLSFELGCVVRDTRAKKIICRYKGKQPAPFWERRELGEDICITCGVPLTEENRGKGPVRCRSCFDEFYKGIGK